MSHAKTLFLINDQESKVLETHLVREHRMGSDHDVYRPAGQTFAGVMSLFR